MLEKYGLDHILEGETCLGGGESALPTLSETMKIGTTTFLKGVQEKSSTLVDLQEKVLQSSKYMYFDSDSDDEEVIPFKAPEGFVSQLQHWLPKKSNTGMNSAFPASM